MPTSHTTAFSRSPHQGSFRSNSSTQRTPCHHRRHIDRSIRRQIHKKCIVCSTATDEDKDLSEEYSETMQQKMGSSLTYRHEAGMNFAEVAEGLIVGSCLQTPADLDRLVEEEGVGTVLCLQQDTDMAYFSLDIAPIIARASERGDVRHVRHEIRDFDPFSLRINLRQAVSIVHRAFENGEGKVYIHCTAGMGRAPAVALGYMFWCRGMELQDAYKQLYAVRPCNPKLFAIREATCDLLFGAEGEPVTISVRGQHPDTLIEAAGLDIGWGQRVQFEYDAGTKTHSLQRQLLPGRYQYKLIYDGDHWSYSANHPTLTDGGNINNYVDVIRNAAHAAACSRLMQENGGLTAEEKAQIAAAMALF